MLDKTNTSDSVNSTKSLEVFEAIITALEALVHTNPDAKYSVMKAREALTALSGPDTKPLPFGSGSANV